MAQVSLIDSDRLSRLLEEALSWSNNVSSLMVTATNGSILACAFREGIPKIRKMRSMSSTVAAAYSVSADDTLTFEAQNTGAVSVITPIGDHALLAATGPQPAQYEHLVDSMLLNIDGQQQEQDSNEDSTMNGNHGRSSDRDEDTKDIRADLEIVSHELASTLQDHLSNLKWPEDV